MLRQADDQGERIVGLQARSRRNGTAQFQHHHRPCAKGRFALAHDHIGLAGAYAPFV
jgi:hypothetical protein